MTKLTTLKPRLAVANTQRLKAMTVADHRMTGWKLQQRRKRLWAANPCCAECGRLTEYPHGFELDHIVSLYQGGPDTDDNCQILCNGENGCHRKKTRQDMNHKQY
ncbi:HNH endonuclease [Pantoea sp. BAV 3049]|uniref:HNH endonuclease n=1 Tax=Pantoea sp. BAV 3049 TaxID=2654188 RepID=UPI00131BADA6|nr:HNH endonuclease signature motif containing protein [Pantoea sp. BAV 3049]